MQMYHPGINSYCNFCGTPLRFQISRAGETVNCFNCCMETVLFIPGTSAPYAQEEYVLEARDVQWSEGRFGVRNLVGAVENKSRKHLNWVRIEFILFSQPGSPIGTTSDCLLTCPPGRIWKFQAPVSQKEAQHASHPLLSCEYGRILSPKSGLILNGVTGAPSMRNSREALPSRPAGRA
jgi:hypothetical protein